MSDFSSRHYDTHGPFDIPMKDAQAKALDAILKTIPNEQPKYLVTAKTAELLPGERADISWISTEDPDRDNEIVVAKGMDASHFKLNPLVTLQHNYNIPPVGRSVWQKRQADGPLVGIKAKTQYPQRPKDWPGESDWQPDLTFSLIQNGLLSGKSIGFLATKSHSPTDQEIKTNPGLADCRRIIDEWLLLEYACVYIPCQQNAVVEAVSKGLKIPEHIIELFQIPKDWTKSPLQQAIQKHGQQIDQQLLNQCVAALALAKKGKLPQDLGIVDNCKVLLIDGDAEKVKADIMPDDYEHPHMDFVEAANDMEAAWVRREYGDHTFVLDDDHTPSEAAPDLYHEAVERRMMSLGMCYDDAHTVANAAELVVRQAHPELTDMAPNQPKAIHFTSLDQIEHSITRQINQLDLQAIAEKAVAEAIDRARGRV